MIMSGVIECSHIDNDNDNDVDNVVDNDINNNNDVDDDNVRSDRMSSYW